MSQFVRADQEQLEEIHGNACRFVEQVLRDDSSPNIAAGAYPPDCKPTPSHFIVPLYGANRLIMSKRKFDMLEQWFPGAFLDEEKMSDDTLETVRTLNIPITWHKSTMPGKKGKRVAFGDDGGKPSLERALLWTAAAIACGVGLYYRYQTGAFFF